MYTYIKIIISGLINGNQFVFSALRNLALLVFLSLIFFFLLTLVEVSVKILCLFSIILMCFSRQYCNGQNLVTIPYILLLRFLFKNFSTQLFNEIINGVSVNSM